MTKLILPTRDGRLEEYVTGGPKALVRKAPRAYDRVVFAAAHVVADPLAAVDPWLDAPVDWDATLAVRQRLIDLGFGIAEAMDTAQRGMGLSWETAQELIRRSLEAFGSQSGTRLACGAGTDPLVAGGQWSLADVLAAYRQQVEVVEGLGGQVILMASRALARCARGPDDYAEVYGRILDEVRQPVILHWLGPMFDPALEGYWGHRDLDAATDACLAIIEAHAEKVEGMKISLLDKEREVAMRRRLPRGIRMFTGDDFHFAELIAGDAEGYSDALLGIFDGIAPLAANALGELASGNVDRFHEILAPTVPLSRHVFAAPTRFYKTGLVCLAWLAGHQDHFVMIGGQQSARSIIHLAELFRLADAAGLMPDPDRAAHRMRALLAMHGIQS
ncbi:MAG: dihydrodipicolinate synthase family protein [Planctomycetota bacterium]